jgi:cell wall-associated NlpC family hydrolase
MAGPIIAALGLCIGTLGGGAVLLAGAATTLSVGAPGTATASGSTTAFGVGPPGTPAVSPAAQAAAEAAAASCPGLDWTLLAGGVLVDPALAAGLTSAASDLCQSANRAGTLVDLLPGPVEGEVAVVLSHALNSEPTLSSTAATAISFAAANLGAPYLWGGTGSGGFDCSGLTLRAYEAAGVHIPRVAQDQYDAGPILAPGAAVEPGDLVFFGAGPRDVSHVGIYIGGGDMIDAPHTGAFVRIEPTPTTIGAPFGSDVYVGATQP